MKILSKILLTVAATAALSCATPTFANIVVNGGFETGSFVPGWTQVGNTGFTGVGTLSPTGVGPHSGSFLAFFGAVGSDGGIVQNLVTNAGNTYNLSFWLANDTASSPSDFSLLWNGGTIYSVVNPGPSGYTLFTFNGLLATGALTSLEFEFRQDPAYFELDDISVVSAPDGGNTLWLLGLAMVGICLIRRWAPVGVK
jgi:hypothetical protein